MSRHVVLLHTASLHIATFTCLTEAIDPTLRVEHCVDESLLAEAMRSGADDPMVIKRIHKAMRSAAGTGAAIVCCTCSTIGAAAERTPTGGRFIATRIDRAMADRAVQSGPRILMVAALQSTLAPTAALLQESAAAQHRDVEIEPLLVPGAWSCFTKGDSAGYRQAIEQAVRSGVGNASVVVLAQASMAPAAAALRDLGVEVLSSPVLGVQSILRRLGG